MVAKQPLLRPAGLAERGPEGWLIFLAGQAHQTQQTDLAAAAELLVSAETAATADITVAMELLGTLRRAVAEVR